MFKSASSFLSGNSRKIYDDNNKWHNIFRKEVFDKIDENIFKPLYSDDTGAPNAHVNVLLSMMILKEGFGWSDEELFENCQFNLLVRSALSMFDLDAKPPSQSCYYLFRQRIFAYQEEKGEDLLGETFASLTLGQSKKFNVNGKSIRMDSKLLGSNIARLSRFELIHRTIQKFYTSLEDEDYKLLPEMVKERLDNLLKEDAEKEVYRNNSETICERLGAMGEDIAVILETFATTRIGDYNLLERTFKEQYEIIDGAPIPISRKQLKATNVQSPEDPDCTYREKSDQKIYGGYSGNVTETNSDEGLNLVTDVKVKPASAADKDFYQDGVAKTEESTGDKVERTYADGAYHSQDNKDFNEERDITMVLTGLQGKQSRFDLKENEEGIEVTDTKTGETGIAKITKSGKRYGIKIDGKNRYFTEEQIENQKFRKYVSSFSSQERSKRNNVEATVFQLCYFTRNNKIKYRGIAKAQAWAYMRCLWINTVRIVNFMGEVCENEFKKNKLIQQNS